MICTQLGHTRCPPCFRAYRARIESERVERERIAKRQRDEAARVAAEAAARQRQIEWEAEVEAERQRLDQLRSQIAREMTTDTDGFVDRVIAMMEKNRVLEEKFCDLEEKFHVLEEKMNAM